MSSASLPSSKKRARRRTGRVDVHVRRNRTLWNRISAVYETRHARLLEREGGRAWGVFRVPERHLELLGNVRGKDVLELGCGAAWWSVALARDGARVVGLDFSPERLAQARARMRAARVDFPLVEASAERIPYPAGRFDIVLSDYGATTFADPYRWIPEVARVLRKGGILVFAHASPFRSVTEDRRGDRVSRTLRRDYFGLHALRDSDGVEFQLPYGEWFRLFSSCGLVAERLVEPAAPRTWRSTYLSARDQAWGRRWPIETLWKLRKGSIVPSAPVRRGAARPIGDPRSGRAEPTGRRPGVPQGAAD